MIYHFRQIAELGLCGILFTPARRAHAFAVRIEPATRFTSASLQVFTNVRHVVIHKKTNQAAEHTKNEANLVLVKS